MWTNELLTRVNKEDIINICSLNVKKSAKKDEIISKAIPVLDNNLALSEELDKVAGDKIAIHPSRLEELLNISKTERKKWSDKLPVRYIESVRMYGKYADVPMYDYFKALKITKDDIAKWREEDHQKSTEHSKQGVIKAKDTKTRNKIIIDDFYNNTWVEMISSWKEIDLELALTYQLAYWTMWCSRMAKKMQEKAYRSIKKTDEYLEKKEYFYRCKNEAIRLLSKSKYAKISFYRPKNPNKIDLTFCDNHYNKWRILRGGVYIGKWEYYDMNKKEILECEECDCYIQEDYYSLYYMEIKNELIKDYSFSFHMPYTIGKNFLESPDHYNKVHHKENNEGLFRFGRSIYDEELVIFTESKIIKYFEISLNEYKEYLKLD